MRARQFHTGMMALAVALAFATSASAQPPGTASRVSGNETDRSASLGDARTTGSTVDQRRITRSNSARQDRELPAANASPGLAGAWSLGGPFMVVLLMAAVGVAVWKRQGMARTPSLPRDVLDVLGRRPLDPRLTVWLVRLGSRVLVLGASPTGFSTLAEVTDPVEVDLLSGLSRRSTAGASGAAEAFSSSFLRSGAESAAAEDDPLETTAASRLSREALSAADAFSRKLHRAAKDVSGRGDSRAA